MVVMIDAEEISNRDGWSPSPCLGQVLGVPMSPLARKVAIPIPSVSESLTRGQKIVEDKRFFCYRLKNLTAFIPTLQKKRPRLRESPLGERVLSGL